MPAKYSYEYIKDFCKGREYSVLTPAEDYMNASTKMDLRCPKGHVFSMTFTIFKFGHGCPFCAGNRKFTIDEVRNTFASENYTLLTENYINTFQNLECICPNGHTWSTKFYSFYNMGKRCFYCSKNCPPTIEEIKVLFESAGYELLSKKYTHRKAKLDYICVAGHRGAITWDSWRRGHRCSTCRDIARFGESNPNWRGGITNAPYCQDWTDQLRDYIKFRDGYVCMGLDCNKTSNKICVHHIDYNKKSCGPENLITLCNSCNAKANFDREWHQAWYQALLSMRYGYKYSKLSSSEVEQDTLNVLVEGSIPS